MQRARSIEPSHPENRTQVAGERRNGCVRVPRDLTLLTPASLFLRNAPRNATLIPRRVLRRHHLLVGHTWGNACGGVSKTGQCVEKRGASPPALPAPSPPGSTRRLPRPGGPPPPPSCCTTS